MRQQQPALAFHQVPRRPSLAKELRSSYLVDRIAGMLHDVKLVVDDLAFRRPLFDAQPERLPHINARPS